LVLVLGFAAALPEQLRHRTDSEYRSKGPDGEVQVGHEAYRSRNGQTSAERQRTRPRWPEHRPSCDPDGPGEARQVQEEQSKQHRDAKRHANYRGHRQAGYDGQSDGRDHSKQRRLDRIGARDVCDAIGTARRQEEKPEPQERR
jgi:hypothetical protein